MNSTDVQPSIQQSHLRTPNTAGAHLIKGGIGTILMIAGAGFILWLWHAYQFAEETRRWIATPCIVVSSQILNERPTPNSPMSYRAGIRYRYTFNGKIFDSTRIRRVEGWSANADKARAIVAMYPIGKSTRCFVNPAQPDFAILEHSTRAALYTLWFPMLFFVGGAGVMLSAIRGAMK